MRGGNVIELTFSAVTDAPIETTIYSKINKWSKSDWAYFSAMNDDPNEATINLENSKKGIEWKIEVIGLNFRWSSMFQWRHRSIHRETKEWIKHWRMMERTSQSWTLIQSNWDNDSSRRKQGIEWHIEGRSSLPLSDDRRIRIQWRQLSTEREKQGLEWKFVKWPNLLFGDSMSVVFHVM